MTVSLPDSIESVTSRGVPVAQLSVISLAKLHANDPTELALLEKAASTPGFFYLDFRGDAKGEIMLAHVPEVYALAKKYFSQPDDVKAKDARDDIKPSQDLGWKKGRGAESFETSRAEVGSADPSTLRLPKLFQDEWKRIAELSTGCDEVCATLLNCLSADFAQYHRVDQASDTGMKLVLHPSLTKLSDVDENLHTDSGTITLLFFQDWGIHGYFPDVGMWGFTPPLEGCALINVANSLQRMSGGKFHSPEHRVTQPFDGARDRYYISYYLRPETAVLERWGSEN